MGQKPAATEPRESRISFGVAVREDTGEEFEIYRKTLSGDGKWYVAPRARARAS